MTQSEPVDELVPRIQRQYLEQPRGWHLLRTPRGDMLIIGPDSAFQLKLVQVNPREFTGVGTEVPRSSKEIERITESPEFGLRAITDADIQEIVQSLTSQIDVRPKLQSIIQRNPLVHDEIRDTGADLFLSGPVLTTPDFKSLSVETLKLQKSLERDAMETFRRKYPHRAGMFI